MNDISAVSLSTRRLLETQPEVQASVQFYSQFKGELVGDLKGPSSGTVFPSDPVEPVRLQVFSEPVDQKTIKQLRRFQRR